MKIEARNIEGDDGPAVVLTKVYSGVLLDTDEGEALGICMRDGAFEINVIGDGPQAGWYRVSSHGVIKEVPLVGPPEPAQTASGPTGTAR